MRTLGWLNHSHRLSKNYERLTRTDESWIYLVMIRIRLESPAGAQAKIKIREGVNQSLTGKTYAR